MDRMASLSAFVPVVENGGFTAAARRLDLSPTMISNHVQALENELGVRLLNRTTRKVSVYLPPDSSLMVRRLAGWRHLPCCAPAYLETHPAPRSPADLAGHNCIRYSYYPYGDEWHLIDLAGKPVAVRVSGNLVTSSAHVMRAFPPPLKPCAGRWGSAPSR